MSITASEILGLSEPVQRWLMERADAPSCANCLFFKGPGLTCTAFPEGIPPTILSGEQQHLTAVDGDHGIRWQPAEDPASGTKTVHVKPYEREGHPVAGYDREGGGLHHELARELTLEDVISVAEQAMERAGQEGRHWTVPDGRYDDPKVMEANRAMSEFASKVYDDNGGPQAVNADEYPWALSVKVQASNWMQHETPGAQGSANIYTNSISVPHDTHDMTILHETAHLIRKEHGHTPEFARLLHKLYEKYIGKEAADTYWGIVGFRLGKPE